MTNDSFPPIWKYTPVVAIVILLLDIFTNAGTYTLEKLQSYFFRAQHALAVVHFTTATSFEMLVLFLLIITLLLALALRPVRDRLTTILFCLIAVSLIIFIPSFGAMASAHEDYLEYRDGLSSAVRIAYQDIQEVEVSVYAHYKTHRRSRNQAYLTYTVWKKDGTSVAFDAESWRINADAFAGYHAWEEVLTSKGVSLYQVPLTTSTHDALWKMRSDEWIDFLRKFPYQP